MKIARITLKIAALMGLTLAFSFSFASAVHAQEGYDGYDGYGGYDGEDDDACDPSQEGVAGYEGYDGYDGCDETAAPTPTPTPAPSDPGGLGGALPQTGGVTLLAAAGVVGAVGLTIRRLATS